MRPSALSPFVSTDCPRSVGTGNPTYQAWRAVRSCCRAFLLTCRAFSITHRAFLIDRRAMLSSGRAFSIRCRAVFGGLRALWAGCRAISTVCRAVSLTMRAGMHNATQWWMRPSALSPLVWTARAAGRSEKSAPHGEAARSWLSGMVKATRIPATPLRGHLPDRHHNMRTQQCG
uniref:Uncharacterized protein n=1 Tax=Candidatus Kentrum sp. MB TaxID=2138164 RepID=A0A450XI37_9GAMM|nr:MAG: hypothetical protein BECKMB1821G_GA0114241_104215 [Candidatus Kentron sp. MB]